MQNDTFTLLKNIDQRGGGKIIIIILILIVCGAGGFYIYELKKDEGTDAGTDAGTEKEPQSPSCGIKRSQIVYTGCGYTYQSKANRDTQCYNTGTIIKQNISWKKGCYYCCPKYTQKTYMENNALPYPPILTYQYNNGDCSAEKDYNSSICKGYTKNYNNGIPSDPGCGRTTVPQYTDSVNCLFDLYADTCAGNKLYSVAKNNQLSFNKNSESIGIDSYKYNNYGSHIGYPYIVDNCQNYSIYQWLLDISFISELNCYACNISGCTKDKASNILHNRTCISSNSFSYNKCCSGTIVDLCDTIPPDSPLFSQKAKDSGLGTCNSWDNDNKYYYCSKFKITYADYNPSDAASLRKICPSSCHLSICLNEDNPNFRDKYKYTCNDWKKTVKYKQIIDGNPESCSDIHYWSRYSQSYMPKDLSAIIYNCPHACNICPDS